MRRTVPLAAAALLASAAVAFGGDTARIERAGFRVEMPAGWKELPEIANALENAVLGRTTDVVGDAVAHGDVTRGVVGIVLRVSAKKPVDRVRPEIEAFHAAFRASVEGNGTRITSWKLTETSTRIVATMEGEAPTVRLRGTAIAVVDKKGILHGWTAQCATTTRAGKRAADDCDAFLGSFQLTISDRELKRLEKR